MEMGFTEATKLPSARAFGLSNHHLYRHLSHYGYSDQIWYVSGHCQHTRGFSDHRCVVNFPALYSISVATTGGGWIFNQVDSCMQQKLLSSTYSSPESRHSQFNKAHQFCSHSSSRSSRSIQNFGLLPARIGKNYKEPFLKRPNLQFCSYRCRKFVSFSVGSDGERETVGLKRAQIFYKVLVTAEAICIVGAAASQTTCLMSLNRSQQGRHTSTSVGELPPLSNYMQLSTWQVLPLWIALVINAILRARQSAFTQTFGRNGGGLHTFDSNLALRVKNLEEDLGNGLTIMRSLARQFEKLGVRFRVTRRTLRDPIQETALLSKKTSDIVNNLKKQHDRLEDDLKSINNALLMMQEQQIKQLDLISKIVNRTQGTRHLPSQVSAFDHNFSLDDTKQISGGKSLKEVGLQRRPAALQELAEKLEDVRQGLRKWRDVALLGECSGKEKVHNIQTDINSNASHRTGDVSSIGAPSSQRELPEIGQTKFFPTPRVDFWTTPLHQS